MTSVIRFGQHEYFNDSFFLELRRVSFSVFKMPKLKRLTLQQKCDAQKKYNRRKEETRLSIKEDNEVHVYIHRWP